jgi:hypothetical protein
MNLNQLGKAFWSEAEYRRRHLPSGKLIAGCTTPLPIPFSHHVDETNPPDHTVQSAKA